MPPLKASGKFYGNSSQTWEILYQGILLGLQHGDNMPLVNIASYKLHPDHSEGSERSPTSPPSSNPVGCMHWLQMVMVNGVSTS
jgi:hypothetical protein